MVLDHFRVCRDAMQEAEVSAPMPRSKCVCLAGVFGNIGEHRQRNSASALRGIVPALMVDSAVGIDPIALSSSGG